MTPAERHLIADGHDWVIFEIPAPVSDRRGGMHLIFASLEVIRRVPVYPTNWAELPDDALYALTDRKAAN